MMKVNLIRSIQLVLVSTLKKHYLLTNALRTQCVKTPVDQ